MKIEELNALVKEFADLRQEYQEAYYKSSGLKKKCDEAKYKLIDILNDSNLKNYAVEGIGKISVINKYSVKVPQAHDDRKKMLDYFREKGEEGDMLLTVHSQTLRSLYNAEKEDDPTFSIPGVAEPTLEQNLSFRK